MYLHDDKEIFEEIIQKTHEELGYELDIIEKDYYVTMMLRELAKTGIDFVFKGGTSLSKAYKAINRFSEDIDLTVKRTEESLSQSERVDMADKIMSCAAGIGLQIANRAKIRRRGHFNRYVFEYESIFEKTLISPRIVVETFVTLRAFPTEARLIDSMVGNTLERYDKDKLAEYGLTPFSMFVQSIKRTFVDKVFALCDYYLESQCERQSRHIYDLHQILEQISLDSIAPSLIEEVRREREKDKRCLSVQAGINPAVLLSDIVAKDFFKADYEDITETLLYVPVSYDQARTALEKVIQSGLFAYND